MPKATRASPKTTPVCPRCHHHRILRQAVSARASKVPDPYVECSLCINHCVLYLKTRTCQYRDFRERCASGSPCDLSITLRTFFLQKCRINTVAKGNIYLKPASTVTPEASESSKHTFPHQSALRKKIQRTSLQPQWHLRGRNPRAKRCGSNQPSSCPDDFYTSQTRRLEYRSPSPSIEEPSPFPGLRGIRVGHRPV